MKISTTRKAALVAASALAVLAPVPAFAAEAPACTTENIAYLNSQDKQEDSEAKVATAQRAYDRAKDDRAAFGTAVETADDLFGVFMHMTTPNGRAGKAPVAKAERDLIAAAGRFDATAAADAAVAAADAGQKALDSMTKEDKQADYLREGDREQYGRRLITQLRSEAEAVRKATTGADVDARKTDLDTAVSDKAEADKGVRPARDTYRDCLANANA